MKVKPIYFDILFIVLLELILLGVYYFGPTPDQFPFLFSAPLDRYFSENISQFFLIMYIPYLPELLFHITNLSMAFFLGLSILWIPSLFVLIWLIREFFSKVLNVQNFRFYYAYFPILFTVFMPHTLIDIFTFNGSHFFSTLSQIFIMFISILSGISFFLSGRKLFFFITLISVFFVNIQTFSMSLFLLSIILLISVLSLQGKQIHSLRAVFLIILSVFISLVYLYASFGTSTFPYQNLSIPNIGPTDPNFRVFLLSIFSPSRGLWNVFTMQNYVNDPYFPSYYPSILYSIILLVVTLISLIPFFYFNNKLRRVSIPIYLSLLGLELLNSMANPFISLVFPQNISIFYDVSYIFNNNTVFYNLLQILISISFTISIISFPDFLKFMKAHFRKFSEFNFKKQNKKLSLYVRPVLAVVFAITMVSPLVAFSVNHGTGNPVPYNEYEPFVSYFENHGNASVYFDNTVPSKIITLIESDSSSISNPDLSPDQVYPLSVAMQHYDSVYHPLQSCYLDYLLTMFGYNYYSTSNSTRSSELSSSGLFSMVLNYSGLQVLKIKKPVNQTKIVLLSSSVSALIYLVDNFKVFPTWIYSPYLLNKLSLEKLYEYNSSIYMPSFDNQYRFFIYLNDIRILIPAQYSDNTYYSNQWEIGYLPTYAQETWTQNIAALSNYSYQSEVNVNYGFIFSSQKNVSLKIHYSLPAGSYEVLINDLNSNVGGNLSISVGNNTTTLNTKSNKSYFSYSNIMRISSNGGTNVQIKNINGFNSVGYLVFVPANTYNKYEPLFKGYVNMSTIHSVYRFIGLVNTYNISISTTISDKSLVYQQRISIPLALKGLNKNLSNELITNENGDVIPNWIESIGNINATVWVRLRGEFNRTLKIMIFNTNANLFGLYLGEAPKLSKVYGEYFNAPLIFGSGNAWDWVNSYQGWSSSNSSATFADNGIRVYNGTNGGIYLNSTTTGMAFSLYGWTMNDTVIQFGIIDNGNYYAYGFVGTSPYAVQKYPVFTNNINVFGGQKKFYLFTISAFSNGTMISTISNSMFSLSYYPVNYTGIQIGDSITASPAHWSWHIIRSNLLSAYFGNILMRL